MSEDNRDQRLNIRITADEKERLRQAAEKDRRSLSSFIVASALEKADAVLDGD